MSVAAHTEVAPSVPSGRISALRRGPVLASVLGLLMVAATAEIVLDGAVGHSPLIPKSPDISSWLTGVGERLGFRVFLIALLVSSIAYAGLVVASGLRGRSGISARGAIGLIGVLHLIVFVGPILLSTDVFSYIAYARLGFEHGINPYLNGPQAAHFDPVFPYVGPDWRKAASAYGPLYTLITYPFAPLGVVGALWAMKVEALLASAGTLALVWRCAKLRGFDPVRSLLIVGANPLYFVYGLGGAHNDLVMMLAMMGAVALTLGSEGTSARREGSAAALIVAGAMIKATVGTLLPFMVVARRRVAPIVGAVVSFAVITIAGYAAFGIHGVNIVAALNRDASFVSSDSFANEIAHLLNKPGVFPIDHDILKGGLVLIVLHLLWRTWRGYDWVAASGWALLAISVTSTWLLAWYILWPLPLAVISKDRRLLAATLFIQGLFVVHQMVPLLVPGG